MTDVAATDTRFLSDDTLAARRARGGETRLPAHGQFLVPADGVLRLEFQGKDTLRYLQSKLTVDTRQWSTTGGRYAYATDINGRIIGGGHLSLMESGAVAWWIEAGSADRLMEHLDKYIIMEDVTMTVHQPEQAWLLVDPQGEPPATMPYQTYGDATGYMVLLQRALLPTKLLAGSHDTMTPAIQRMRDGGVPIVAWDTWRAAEIEAGFVRVGFELALGETIPLEVGPDHGVQYNKGCYLGQEVIERLRSRGTPNREFRRVRWEGELQPFETPIVDGTGREVGALLTTVSGGDAHIGIATLRRRALHEEGPLYLSTPDGPVMTILGEAQ